MSEENGKTGLVGEKCLLSGFKIPYKNVWTVFRMITRGRFSLPFRQGFMRNGLNYAAECNVRRNQCCREYNPQCISCKRDFKG